MSAPLNNDQTITATNKVSFGPNLSAAIACVVLSNVKIQVFFLFSYQIDSPITQAAATTF